MASELQNEASALQNELVSYNNQRDILKNIRHATNRFFKEVEEKRICEKDVLYAYFNANEEQLRFLDIVCKRPLTLLVFGQSHFAKATLINKVLQQTVLPVDCDETTNWRRIRIIYGKRNSIATIKFDENGHRMVENAATVTDFPVDESLLQESVSDNRLSTTEVVLNNTALQLGVSVICSPQKENGLGLEDVAHMYLDNLTSVVIFSIEHPTLNSKVIT